VSACAERGENITHGARGLGGGAMGHVQRHSTERLRCALALGPGLRQRKVARARLRRPCGQLLLEAVDFALRAVELRLQARDFVLVPLLRLQEPRLGRVHGLRHDGLAIQLHLLLKPLAVLLRLLAALELFARLLQRGHERVHLALQRLGQRPRLRLGLQRSVNAPNGVGQLAENAEQREERVAAILGAASWPSALTVRAGGALLRDLVNGLLVVL